MELEYGTATVKELPQMVELLGVLFTDEAEFQPDPGKQKRALEALLANPGIGKLFVAREGKRVIAMASLLYTVSTAEGGKAAWFEDLVVHVVRKNQPAQPGGPEVGARGGERRGKISGGAVLGNRAQAQDRLHHRHQWQHPEHQVLQQVAGDREEKQHDDVQEDHRVA